MAIREIGTEPFGERGSRVGEMVYRALREQIVAGLLPSGSRLSVPKLAKEFGVSRSPARDAVGQLVREGLATESLNRGAVVSTFEIDTLVSIYEAREALEWAAARLATEHSSPALVEQLELILAAHAGAVEQDDFSRHVDLDSAFHSAIRSAAKSPVLERMLEQIQGCVTVAMRSTSMSGGMIHALHDHRQITNAIALGDPEAAGEAARAHVQRLKERLRARGTTSARTVDFVPDKSGSVT